MSESPGRGAFREGAAVRHEELLAHIGPGLARDAATPPVPLPGWCELVAVMAARLLRVLGEHLAPHEVDMLTHAIVAMAIGGEHDAERRFAAGAAQANLGIVCNFGTARLPAVDDALGWFPGALEWATHRARLDAKCRIDVPALAAAAAAHHAAVAATRGADAIEAQRTEIDAQLRDVEAVLDGKSVARDA
jgi:hypothetical protein